MKDDKQKKPSEEPKPAPKPCKADLQKRLQSAMFNIIEKSKDNKDPL